MSDLKIRDRLVKVCWVFACMFIIIYNNMTSTACVYDFIQASFLCFLFRR